ncbi:MAG: hypothetical protein KGJ78_13415 [Alphaproteobacteria bacterium]|nr:hypothetical protein [Alphaproteobacteria bacterium]
MRWLAAATIALLGLGGAASAASNCYEEDVPKAYDAIYRVGTWRELSSFYQRYGACDQEAISTGVSDRVADLLANSWNTVEDLKRFAENKDFAEFVLYHVDSLMRAEEAKAILDNVRNHCPTDATELCGRIEHEIVDALPKIPGAGD